MHKLLFPLLLLLTTACVAPNDKPIGKITVSNSTWGSFQEYLGRIGSNRPGAFAIEKDGSGSYYIWCEDVLCSGGPTYKREALIACERDGADCVIFAFGRDILVPYEVAKVSSYQPSGSADQTASAEPTDTRRVQRLSNSLKADVERYLDGSKIQTGKYRFLAVNSRGDHLGLSTSCKALKSGWGGWTSEGCGGEAQAKQLAIDKCGDDCRIIYKGEDLDPAVKIEWY